jgi:hypothetical protein
VSYTELQHWLTSYALHDPSTATVLTTRGLKATVAALGDSIHDVTAQWLESAPPALDAAGLRSLLAVECAGVAGVELDDAADELVRALPLPPRDACGMHERCGMYDTHAGCTLHEG